VGSLWAPRYVKEARKVVGFRQTRKLRCEIDCELKAGTRDDLQVTLNDGKLQIEASGALPVLDSEKGTPIAVVPMSRDQLFVDCGDHTRLGFSHDEAGKATGLMLNPGPWQISGSRDQDQCSAWASTGPAVRCRG